ncbi:hypothetical protein J6590_057570 [Homalodisca vitripennis]|nr:hypothetical protein J6590_057570 [Homalodisca vitripennis]
MDRNDGLVMFDTVIPTRTLHHVTAYLSPSGAELEYEYVASCNGCDPACITQDLARKQWISYWNAIGVTVSYGTALDKAYRDDYHRRQSSVRFLGPSCDKCPVCKQVFPAVINSQYRNVVLPFLA